MLIRWREHFHTPKSRIKVLLLENIHENGAKLLKDEGYQVEVHPAGMDEEDVGRENQRSFHFRYKIKDSCY